MFVPIILQKTHAVYQRMIDINLAGLPTNRILAYMDGIVIFSSTFSDHLECIEQLFKRLQSSNISLKLSKCTFDSNMVDFLGFQLPIEGSKPQSKFTEAIPKYGVPETKKELRPGLKVAFLPRRIKSSSLKNTKCQLNSTQSRRLNPLPH